MFGVGMILSSMMNRRTSSLDVTSVSVALALAPNVAAISAPISAAVFGEQLLFPMFVGFALLVIWKHRENIVRLRAGREPKVGKKTG